MNYQAALYKIHPRRDAYPSIPLRELIALGHVYGVPLADVALRFTMAGKREIMIAAGINEALISIMSSPHFVRCGTDIFVIGSRNDIQGLQNMFSHPPA